MSTRTQGPIVVGVDGAKEDIRALRYAATEAVRQNCGIRLVHVIHVATPLAPLPPVPTDVLRQAGQRIVDDAEQDVRALSKGQVPVETVVSVGARVKVLCAAGEDAAMIVLAHRDRTVVGRVFTSSTTTGVAAHAHCPVVCVSASWAPDVERGHVVVGIEGTDHSRDTLASAFSTADERRASLTVMHAWKLASAYDDITESRVSVDEWKRSAAETLEKNLAEWREAYPEVEVVLDLRHQHPGPAVVDSMEGADLLILGRHGHRTWLGVGMGSIARMAIHEARCPVMIVPQRQTGEALAEDRLLTNEALPQT